VVAGKRECLVVVRFEATSLISCVMAIYNALERPRAVIAGCEADHPVVQATRGLVGSYSVVPLDEQPLQERDVVVVWQDAANGVGNPARIGGGQEKHLRVLQFGGSPVSI
jgi:hypothetical protein